MEYGENGRMKTKAREKIGKIGCLICLTILLAACENREELPETQSYEKGVIHLEEQEDDTYPALGVQQMMELEGADNPAGLFQETCANVCVQVRAGNLKGSGVIIASDRKYVWIATAGHVLERLNPEESIKITFTDGFEMETSAYQRLETQDIAVLKVLRAGMVEKTKPVYSETELPTEDHGQYYRVALVSQDAFDAAKSGDLIIAMGSKSGAGEEAYAGTISRDYVYLEDFGAYMMVAEVVATPGMSGGGLFDAKGRLLGIICGVSEEGEVAVSSIMSLLTLELGMDEP